MSKKQLSILLVILAVVIISAVIWLVCLRSIKPINQNVNQANINQSIDKEIYFELGKKFWLKEDQTAILKNNDLKIKLKKITYSPCPEGVMCVWSGLAASIEVSKEAQSKELGLVLSEDVIVFRFNIELTDVRSDKVSFVVNESKEVIISTDKIIYQQGEEVKITIDNNSGKDVEINYPFYEIRKAGYPKGEGEIEIVRCPCGSKCDMADYITLKNGEKEEYTWNQANQRCEGNKQINEQVPAGTYRVESYLKNEEENKKSIYTEFSIVEQLSCGGLGRIECPEGYFCYINPEDLKVAEEPDGVCKSNSDYMRKCCQECYNGLSHDPTAVSSEAIMCVKYKDWENYKLSDECAGFFRQNSMNALQCESILTDYSLPDIKIQEECEALGAHWTAIGKIDRVCEFNAPDASKECTKASDCIRFCSIDSINDKTGKCSEYSAGGCYSYLDKEGKAQMICVD